MGVQLISIFIILMARVNYIFLLIKSIMILNDIGTTQVRKFIIRLLPYTQFLIVFSNYLCFIKIGERINPLDIFKDLLAYAAIVQLHNIFSSFISENGFLSLIKTQTHIVLIEEAKVRKKLHFIFIILCKN